MKNYQYKILGKWTNEEVPAQRIRELVTNGTLNPYDFIRKNLAEDGKDPQWKESMICKEKGLENIITDWSKLLNVRTKLDQLWITQRDSLLAQITGTNEDPFLAAKRNEEVHKNEEKNYSPKVHPYVREIEEMCLSYWRRENEGQLSKEISDRSTMGSPYACNFENPDDPLDEKREEIFKWFQKNNFNESNIEKGAGCYSFENDDGVLYVGEASSRTFKQRITDHFAKEEKWCRQANVVRFWILDNGKLTSGTSKQRAQLLERVLILYYKPSLNKTEGMKEISGGKIRTDTDVLLDTIESEITGLCDDGEYVALQRKHKKLKSSGQ